MLKVILMQEENTPDEETYKYSTPSGGRVIMQNWQLITTFGSFGTGDENLNGPTCVAVDNNTLFIADVGNSRILKWSIQGGKYLGKIESIKSFALIVYQDYLYIMDTVNEVIKQYNKHDLTLKRTSSAFSNLSDMVYYDGYIYAVDDSANNVYQINMNTLSIEASIEISDASASYEGICELNNYLYVLTSDEQIFQIDPRTFSYTQRSGDFSSYLSAAYYLNSHDGYLFISGNDSNFVVCDGSFQLVEDVTFDTEDWQSVFDLKSVTQHVFIACDYESDKLILMYGYDRNSGTESGDAIEFGEFDFGDDVTIGGTEENLSKKRYIKERDSEIRSRHAWKRSDS